ncbi:diaminopropionate ammonia-lyase [Lutispora saccharofermentans]|uniref:Diaminopropionate ammonia-lyase n=1 Tax=Lutispora saccharofermentans TaxID=3024236 RepID=A0ABT1NJZ1_9FIRM|nr:diaminopropionate ammonia-lyase [Lutispora saccharofermentans]MCQ1530899.1 diaminopropionate ammonia-lyase [Lutispora saccharofermentans]
MSNYSDLKWIENTEARNKQGKKAKVDFISRDVVSGVRAFHKSFPQYAATPLHDLSNLSKELNAANIWIKDESYRFGLNAFKVLGGSYAIGRYICDRTNMGLENLTYSNLVSEDTKTKLGDTVFITATDGNHGRGVAWAAREMGHRSVVFMPKGSAEMRLENIRKEGAEASITEYNYDDAVRLANEYALKNNGVMIQDTAWDGYEKIPRWIMQGYATIADEVEEQLRALGYGEPTHVFLQAGVGSFAASMLGYFAGKYGDDRFISAVLEPDKADCLYRSMVINDGKPHAVTGHMDTIMAGLACGEPNTIGWEILRDYADMFISCPDYVAARGMRILANPIKSDPRIISGESGAVGAGLISLIMQKPEYKELKDKLKLDKASRILIISTEGDTDIEGYRKVVWDGYYPQKLELKG